ncbi:MAG: sensor histidine kinase [Pseudonocardia sp.]
MAVGALDLIVWAGDRELVGGGTLPIWVVPAVTIALCGLLLRRREHPIAVFAVQGSYSTLANLAVPEYLPFACLLAALHAVAAHGVGSAARLALLACTLPFGLFSYRSVIITDARGDVRQFLEAAAVWTVAAVVLWALGRLAYAREQHAHAERERLEREAEQALEAERTRLAHELHDSVSGTVAGMILHAAGARALFAGDDERVRDSLEVIESAGRQAMNELHRMLGLLRSADLGPAGPGSAGPGSAGLGSAERAGQPRFADLDELLERTRRAGVEVSVELDGAPRPLDPSVDLAAYRIVQESLTNVVKHAGTGACARVGVRWGAEELRINVRSRGGGGAPRPGAAGLSSGHGLRGLGERVHLVGGTLESGEVEGGWVVHAQLPVAARADAGADTGRPAARADAEPPRPAARADAGRPAARADAEPPRPAGHNSAP